MEEILFLKCPTRNCMGRIRSTTKYDHFKNIMKYLKVHTRWNQTKKHRCLTFTFYFIYLFILLYNIVLVLPYINMLMYDKTFTFKYSNVILWYCFTSSLFQFSSVQLLSCVWLFATPWTTAHQVSLSITNSQIPPKPMSIESVI